MAAGLDQCHGGVNWIRSGILDCAALTAPIQEFLTELKRLHGFRKPQLAKMILYPEVWTPELRNTFDQVKKVTTSRVNLTHLDCEQRLCISTDASELYYADVFTQVPVKGFGQTSGGAATSPAHIRLRCFQRHNASLAMH